MKQKTISKIAVSLCLLLVIGVMQLNLTVNTYAATSTINNNTYWTDTNGNSILCQGGNILQIGDTYYWCGMDYLSGGSNWWTIKLYSSKDLVHWTFLNNILSPNVNGAPHVGSDTWIGRPNIVYNSASHQYVLLFQYWGVTAAVCDTIDGNYTWVGPLPNLTNSRLPNANDFSVFQEGNDAYVVTNETQGDTADPLYQHSAIWHLRTSDYLALDNNVYDSVTPCEAHSLMKVGNKYYWFGSLCNGWKSSYTFYRTADSLSGPWTSFDLCDEQSGDGQPNNWDSFDTQHDFEFPVIGTQTTSYIYAGDRWSEYEYKNPGYNDWYPLTFDSTGKPIINGYASWNIDAQTGVWSGNNQAVQLTPTPTPTSAPVQAPAPGTNLLQNPGFEGSLNGWDGQSNCCLDNWGSQHSGNNSICIWSNGGVNQWVNVQPGHMYTLSGWGRLEISGTVTIGVANSGNDQAFTLSGPNAAWDSGSVTFTPTSSSVQVYISLNGSDGIDVDDLSLVEGTPALTTTPIPTLTPAPTATSTPTSTPAPTATPTPTSTPAPTTTPAPDQTQGANLLYNPGFEGSLDGWTDQYSCCLDDWGSQHSGNSSLCMWGNGWVDQWVAVTPGKTYTLSGWGKLAAGGTVTIGSSYSGDDKSFSISSADWSSGSVSFTPTSSTILIYISLNGTNGMDVDDLSLVAN